eukprot:8354607-Ditylum_brightwellii.AAC.1
MGEHAVCVYIYHMQSEEIYLQGEESEGFCHHIEMGRNAIFPSFTGKLGSRWPDHILSGS